MCRCGGEGCALPDRNHFCPTCGQPHYSSTAAEDCCDFDVTPDD